MLVNIGIVVCIKKMSIDRKWSMPNVVNIGKVANVNVIDKVPITAGLQRWYEVRSLPGTSAHYWQWESNLRPLDL